jgi:MGT family glycosyltransferase
MTHYIFMTQPADGHVTQSLPIVGKLVEIGHSVVWLTGRKYEKRISAIGAKFHPMSEKTDCSLTDVYDFYPGLKELTGLAQVKYYIKHMFLDACEPEIEGLNTILEDFPADILVGDTATLHSYFLSELTGIPSAMISLFPLVHSYDWDVAPYGLGMLPGATLLAKMRNRILNFIVNIILLRDVDLHMNAVRGRLGLPPLKKPFFQAIPIIPELIMHISTPAFEYNSRYQLDTLQYIGPVLNQPTIEYHPPCWWSDLYGGHPVILITQGTVSMDFGDLIVPSIKGLKDQPMLVVAVPFNKELLREIPSNVRIEPFVPFDLLFPHVDVMVTNGGYGGTQMALAHGIPVVVAGATEEKMEVAARVQWSGAGINLRKKSPSAKEIRHAVNQILTNPTYRENAKRIQNDFARYDAPQRASELLEALTNRERH